MKAFIATDASVSGKVAGFGIMIVSDAVNYSGHGILKQAAGPAMAEMRAIANALWILESRDTKKQIKRVTLYSDSLAAVNVFTYKARERTIDKYRGTDIYNLILDYKTRYQVEFVHVKAHTKKKDLPSLMNEWCDNAAKFAQRDYSLKRKVSNRL